MYDTRQSVGLSHLKRSSPRVCTGCCASSNSITVVLLCMAGKCSQTAAGCSKGAQQTAPTCSRSLCKISFKARRRHWPGPAVSSSRQGWCKGRQEEGQRHGQYSPGQACQKAPAPSQVLCLLSYNIPPPPLQPLATLSNAKTLLSYQTAGRQ